MGLESKRSNRLLTSKGYNMKDIHYIIITKYNTYYYNNERELDEMITILNNHNIKYKIFQEKL